jgi:methylphosphotriester-DNA--protein-cysteine methyltransferase
MLLERRTRAREPDEVVRRFVRALARSNSAKSSVSAAADALGVSERTLRRRCEVALGYGPKTLERILRFRRAVRLLSAGRSLAEVSGMAGYADQSHLTHECRQLAARTPADFARSPYVLSANGYN